MFTTIILISIVKPIQSVCWCDTFITSASSKSSSITHKVSTGCNDLEMQSQCQRAECEVVDFVNSVMNYDSILTIAYPPTNKEQTFIEQASLSYALEKSRPKADCSTGLFTTTTLDHISIEVFNIGDIGDGLCYSPQLLKECQKIENGINDYIKNIMINLEKSDSSKEFVEMIRKRVEGSIIPTINCNTSNITQELIEVIDNTTSTASSIIIFKYHINMYIMIFIFYFR